GLAVADMLLARQQSFEDMFQHGSNNIAQQSSQVSEEFRASIQDLADTIASRGEAVHEMLATRLQSFDDMFNHGGAELAERMARDPTTLGNLITRHLAEFDRTVKPYGGEMVERLGARSQEISGAMREYLDTFDTRVTANAAEVTTSIDQQFLRFRDSLAARAQTLTGALGSRVNDRGQDHGRGRQGSGRRARSAHRRRDCGDQRPRRRACRQHWRKNRRHRPYARSENRQHRYHARRQGNRGRR